MKRFYLWPLAAAALFILMVLPAFAGETQMLPPSGDPWATHVFQNVVTDAALLNAGASVYTSCASCHLADGGGRPDGAIPRLAGQPAGIVERKLFNLQNGTVFLPVMAAFANSLSPREVTAVSAYIEAMPKPVSIGTGHGAALESGKETFGQWCAGCHGANGEGNVALGAPRLCGQHYGYILRRVDEVTAQARLAGNPGMTAIVQQLDKGDLPPIADYLSRASCNTSTEATP